MTETPEQKKKREAMERRWDQEDTPAPIPVIEEHACPHTRRKIYEDGKCRECFVLPLFTSDRTISEIMKSTGFSYPSVTYRLRQLGITPKADVRTKTKKVYAIEKKRPLSKRAYQMPMPNYVPPTRRDGGVKKGAFVASMSVSSGRVVPRFLHEDDDF